MPIQESTLPYRYDALEPHISSKTLRYHHDKHHNGYINKLNDLIAGTTCEDLPLEDLIVRARIDANMGVLSNAAQAWNHAFLWESMSPSGETEPEGRIKNLVEESFGSIETFKSEFRDKALSLTGSGWIWLVQDGSKLRVVTTMNADTPVGTALRPLLVLDVWEHAYYLDYQNLRADYVAAFLDKLINWKFAASNLQPEAPKLADVA
jgi:Fe-Mn family superoxide dismutase